MAKKKTKLKAEPKPKVGKFDKAKALLVKERAKRQEKCSKDIQVVLDKCDCTMVFHCEIHGAKMKQQVQFVAK